MDLSMYREKIKNLDVNEQVLRDLYLRDLALGKLQGPMTGYASLDKPWLKWYQEEEIRSAKIPRMSIYENMRNHTIEFGKRIAFEYFGMKITYDEFEKNIDRVAKSLCAMGVKEGDIVSVCLPNIPEVGYIFYAINKIGAVANMLDPRTNESTLTTNVNDTGSTILLTLDSVCDKFLKTNVKTIVPISAINSLPKPIQTLVKIKDKSLAIKLPKDKRIKSYSQFIKKGNDYKEPIKSVYKKDAPAVIAYTGGTTGAPKGVIVTNEAFNAMIVENYYGDYNVSIGDNCINIAPPWTFYGLSNCFNSYLCMGVKSILIPAIGPDDLGKLIAKYNPNHVITVPSALIAVMNDPELQKRDLNFLKTIIVGADKLDPTFEEKFNQFLKQNGSSTQVTKGYGMTEVCAATTYTKNGTNIGGTVGVPYILENVSIFDSNDSSKECMIGEHGEIAIKGPKNMVGYFDDKENRTADVLKKHTDGTTWVHTGDIGHMDENGMLYIDGRLKRMFVKNGFKIFPGEIETQILKNNEVEQAAVVAVDDQSNGYIAKAYIVIKKGIDMEEEAIIDKVKQGLQQTLYDYEIPDSIEAIDKMPLTLMNKIDYKTLEARSSENPPKTLKR